MIAAIQYDHRALISLRITSSSHPQMNVGERGHCLARIPDRHDDRTHASDSKEFVEGRYTSQQERVRLSLAHQQLNSLDRPLHNFNNDDDDS